MNPLETEIKELIIRACDLENMTIADIDASAPLFGTGLGLDSIDALEIGVELQKKYHFKLNANLEKMRDHFYSVQSIAKFVENFKTNGGHSDQ